MASLVAHGDRSVAAEPAARPIYVRPILRPRADLDGRPEEAPQDELWIDVVHRAVVRIFGTDQQPGVASSVRVINLSVGDRFRPFIGEMSPLARLLDWLSWRYQVLFIVSADNHGDALVLEAADDTVEVRAFKALHASHRHRRLLCPAESINALTIGALHADEAGEWKARNADEVELVTTAGMPSPVSALGRGFRKSVKPDLFAPGGRVVFARSIANKNEHKPALYRQLFPPGQRTAAPKRGVSDHEEYSVGTSNAAALVTRASMRILDVIDEVNESSTAALSEVPPALLAKCLLVHTSTWNSDARSVLERALKNPHNQSNFRDHLAAFVGYGALRSDRALECTVTRATLIGGGSAELGSAVEHRIPLPPSLNAYTGSRRITVTLAWFSPIKPSVRNYRIAALDIAAKYSKNANLAIEGADADGNAAKRGTVQHVVLAGDRSAVNVVDGAELVLTVNVVADAADSEAYTIPYALAVTVEVPEAAKIRVHDEIRTRIPSRVRARRAPA
jgi:hypothetical protein